MLQLPETPALEPIDRIELLAAPDLPGVEVLRVDATARVWRWYHDTYSVCTPVAPMRAEWKYRSQLHRTEPIFLALMEPGEVHADVSKFDAHEAFRALLISPDVMHTAAQEMDGVTGEVHWREAKAVDRKLFLDCQHLHAALESERTALERQTRFTGLVERLTGSLVDRRPVPAGLHGEPTAVRRVRELLDERWADNVQLDELVAVAGVNRFRLIRAFREAVGLPPHAYQIRMRVGRAKTLIRLGLPLVDVAMHTGFADQSHLTRHFTRVIGVSPGRYRRAVR